MGASKKRVLAIMHEDLIPPSNVRQLSKQDRAPYQTELDVLDALTALGHDVKQLGLSHELAPLRMTIKEWKPDLVFNLLEEFRDDAMLDFGIVAYLELLGVPYTGCNARGMFVGRDKALSKKILAYHRVHTPHFVVLRRGRKFKAPPRKLQYPLIVKSLTQDASLGISEASVVKSEAKLEERVTFIHEKIGTAALVEEFIEGREVYVTVIGRRRLQVFPPSELTLGELRAEAPRIATQRVKWDVSYQKKYKIAIKAAELEPEVLRQITRVSRRIYRVLRLSGYARLDFRLREDGRPYFLEANPNPDVERESEAAGAAKAAGLSYEQFIERLVRVGLRSLED